MLRSVRANEVPAFDAAVESHAALDTRSRVHAAHVRNLVLDDALFLRAFPRRGGLERSVVTVVLEGSAVVRAGGTVARVVAGRGFRLGRKEGLSLRIEAAPTYRSVVYEWPDDEPAPTLRTFDGTGAGDALYGALRAGAPPDRILAMLADHAERLAESGVVFAAPQGFEPVPDALQRLSSALDAQLGALGAQPMAVDLEQALGHSARHASRLTRELHERYGLNAAGWVDLRNRRRLMLAVALLSRPDAPVAVVAEVVGYRSPQVLARAFAQAGLPAPRDVAEAVRLAGA
ncbi:MAG: hypothetical protein R3F59_27370 [Myxococcota bacterium]